MPAKRRLLNNYSDLFTLVRQRLSCIEPMTGFSGKMNIHEFESIEAEDASDIKTQVK